MTWREILGRLRAWRHKDALDRALAEELEDHLARVAREFETDGMDAAAAREAARRKLGNLTSLREQSRDAWGFPAVTALLRDLRYAVRGLGRSPGFTIAAIATFGLGIGANAAIFGVMDRLMFRPFPLLRDPASVDRVYLQTTTQGRIGTSTTFPFARYLDLARDTRAFAAHAAVSEWRFGVGGAGEDTRVRKVAGVSASLFAFFDAPPVRGRYFHAAEDSVPSGALVAVIAHRFWVTDYASGDVVGRALKVGRLTYTIVGVAPPGFVGTVNGGAPDVFVPITTIPANLGESVADYAFTYRWDWVEMLVRRRRGVSAADASADLTQALIRSRATARALNPRVLPDSIARPRGIAGPVRTAGGPDRGPEARVLLWASGVAGIVLLIACASVANLMLARVIRRRKEITVRIALGISRRRLAAQFAIESTLLALLGAVAGMFVAQWSGIAIRTLMLPEGTAFVLAGDWRTTGVALACVAACALLTASAPAFAASRTDLAASLKVGTHAGRRRTPLQAALLIIQVSLSAVLLVGAALFVRSFLNARAVPLGYDVRSVLEVITDFRGLDAGPAGDALRRRMLHEARALPGVTHVTHTNSGLFRTSTASLRVPGIDSVEALGRFSIQLASADYFDVMRTRILRGRTIEASDRLGAPTVAVVSEAMGHALWPGRDPIGQCLHIGFGNRDAASAGCTTVIGVAENAARQGLTDDPRLTYYLPIEQFAPELTSTMLLRLAVPSADTRMEDVRRALTRAMPGDGFVVVRPLQEIVDDRRRSWQLGATLFVVLGGLAFVVAAVGLYGVISYDVTGRAHELGVRAALGASPVALVRLVVMGGLGVALIGVATGAGVAYLAARWVQPLLFEQSARDPLVLAGVAVLMLFVAGVASAAPALRAARSDPATALRAD